MYWFDHCIEAMGRLHFKYRIYNLTHTVYSIQFLYKWRENLQISVFKAIQEIIDQLLIFSVEKKKKKCSSVELLQPQHVPMVIVLKNTCWSLRTAKMALKLNGWTNNTNSSSHSYLAATTFLILWRWSPSFSSSTDGASKQGAGFSDCVIRLATSTHPSVT